MTQRGYSFVAGENGEWEIERIEPVTGNGLHPSARLSVVNALVEPAGGVWRLHGIVSNERYVTRIEKAALLALPVPPAPARAALIALRKSADWWAMTQDERRAIFEARSHHIAIGLELGAGIDRRLHHCRDLSDDEPFDFLTWFEYAPKDEPRFNALLARLRASEEWRFVEREVDIRLVRAR
jgi:hypothetical protein